MKNAASLKEKLTAGKTVLGTWNMLTDPLLTEIFARAGMDFVVIDMEHGPLRLDRVHEYVDKCVVHKTAPIVRIPANEDWMVLQVLDQGAHGVIVPHIDTAEQAQKLVKAARYHPQGTRGYTPFTKAGGFTDANKTHAADSNALVCVGAIIESKEGLDNLDEILKVDGIDFFYFGAYDLSQALGKPGQTKDPVVIKAVTDAVAKVRKAGKSAGAYVPRNKQDIDWVIGLGTQLITYHVDANLVFEHVNDLVNWLSAKG